jgi:hypothetical protein
MAKKASIVSGGKPIKIDFTTHLEANGMRPSRDYIEANNFNAGNPELNDVNGASLALSEARSVCSPDEVIKMLNDLPDWVKSFLSAKSANFVSMVKIAPSAVEDVTEQPSGWAEKEGNDNTN